MNNVFGSAYSELYDSLYEAKDYQNENSFLLSLLPKKKSLSILDLGCGTGGHDILLAQQGYTVTGVDLSEEMINQAIRKNCAADLSVEFLHGDMRTVRIKKKFDLVLSMFAVMSYQTTNQDFKASLETARYHLNTGGILIFDAWYGLAVLHQIPETRIKELEMGEDRVIRIAVPEMLTLANTVIVHYQILQINVDRKVEEIKEDHPMRYFFAPEIELFASETGFEVVKVCPFMDASRKPDMDDWNVTWVLKAV
jgi:SAM-dependent methyltransferase